MASVPTWLTRGQWPWLLSPLLLLVLVWLLSELVFEVCELSFEAEACPPLSLVEFEPCSLSFPEPEAWALSALALVAWLSLVAADVVDVLARTVDDAAVVVCALPSPVSCEDCEDDDERAGWAATTGALSVVGGETD